MQRQLLWLFINLIAFLVFIKCNNLYTLFLLKEGKPKIPQKDALLFLTKLTCLLELSLLQDDRHQALSNNVILTSNTKCGVLNF